MRLRVRAASPRAGRARRAGLSLIEVLLAMAIFSMAVAAISRLVDMGTDRELDARLTSTATRLAQDKLAEVEIGVTAITGSDSSGTCDNEPDWSWTMTQEAHGTNLYLVTVTVSRDLKGRQFTLTLAQMMIDPSVKGSASAATRPTASGATP